MVKIGAFTRDAADEITTNPDGVAFAISIGLIRRDRALTICLSKLDALQQAVEYALS